MPEMNGLEFVTRLREDHRFDSAFIIMVTTETATEQVVRALEAGANEYIMKPFTKDVIEDKLRLLGILN
jgi:two-component system chemotaxis response regulator CheY